MSFSEPPSGAAMPNQPSGSRQPRPMRRGPLVPTIAVLLALGSVMGAVVNAWTEILWFQQIGYFEVFRTRALTQIAVFCIGAAIMAAVVSFNMWLAFRSRPIYAPAGIEPSSMERYRATLEPMRRVLSIAVPAVFGLFAGSALSSQWMSVLTWIHRTPFDTGEGVGRDPQFGLDIGFYVFSLPALRFFIGFAFSVLALSLVVAAVVHYVYGGIRTGGPGPRLTRTARIQLALLLAAILILRALGYWLDRYSLLSADTGSFAGAGYTDVTAVMPAKAILAGIALVVAGLFVATAFTGGWRLPVVGVALMTISAVVIGGLYPYGIQQLLVQPSEQRREEPYLQRNIDATRQAYGVADSEEMPFAPDSNAESGGLREDAETTASIRLMDPAIIGPAFQQLERVKQYYSFPDTLDIGRYEVNGESRDAVVAVRELDLSGLQPQQRSWVNDHTVYTHGFGLVAAYGNQRADGGAPDFFEFGIPPRGELTEFEPRIYFGEKSPDFSIVGNVEGGEQRELDFPTDSGDGAGQQNTTFAGDGGPRIGTFLNRLLYAIKFRDQNILLSNSVNSESQILYDRSPRERVKKVTPWLTLDGDPYPAVVAGRVKWIVDGYTVSGVYPYADQQVLSDATTDQITQQSSSVAALQERSVNYIRNSVKATVDAYDGSVSLYAWDDADPVLKTWMKAFPGTVKPMSEISSELMAHLRYPEDLFKVQRTILGRYHVQDANSFYSGQDFWKIPAEPTAGQEGAASKQPPYYLTLQMPGQESPRFSLTSAFIPNSSANSEASVLTGFMAVDADAGREQGSKAPGYGKIRLLKLPTDGTVDGPGQAQNEFNSDAEVSNVLNILDRGGSSVLRGNLLTLPIGDKLLYVQPVYVRSKGETSIPLLRKVMVLLGKEVGFADTLDEALNQVFGGDSGADAGDAGAPPTPGDGTENQPSDGETGDGSGDNPTAQPTTPTNPDVKSALADAQKAIEESQEALKRGDFAAYGEAQKKLQEALEKAIAAEERAAGQGASGGSDQTTGSTGSESSPTTTGN